MSSGVSDADRRRWNPALIDRLENLTEEDFRALILAEQIVTGTAHHYPEGFEWLSDLSRQELVDQIVKRDGIIRTANATAKRRGEERDAASAQAQALADALEAMVLCSGVCRCDETFTARALRDPDCMYHRMHPEVEVGQKAWADYQTYREAK